MFLSTSLLRTSFLESESKSKEEAGLDDLTFHFNNKLQTIMKDAGFDFAEREVYHRSFLEFMHVNLLFLAWNVLNTK